jgi:fused signal recognition particle receptor
MKENLLAIQYWLEELGITVTPPIIQLAFLYSALAVLIAVYLWIRIIAIGELPFLPKMRARLNHLEIQAMQLAAENSQLREQLTALYDYLTQFDTKEQPKKPVSLSKLLKRENLVKSKDFEVFVKDISDDKIYKKHATLRRLNRRELAQEAGLDLSVDHLTPSQDLPAVFEEDVKVEDLVSKKAEEREIRTINEVVKSEPVQLSTAKQQQVEIEEPSTILQSLAKTRNSFLGKLSALFLGKETEQAKIYEQLEELLITSDLGVKTTQKLIEEVKLEQNGSSNLSEASLKKSLKDSIEKILLSETDPEIIPEKKDGKPLILMVVGVNGAGKTTTIGKLSWQFRAQGKKVLVAACDTFRAAAVEQLTVWAERSGVEVVSGAENSKPSTIAYQAVHKAQDEGFDVLIIDTAGRLHTRVNLMNELENVVKLIEREQPGAPHETVLVVDGSTGQNALQQAREFNEKAKLSGIIITKLDGTSKGGVVVAIKNELGVPIRYIGTGEAVADLKLFSAEEFAEGLVG